MRFIVIFFSLFVMRFLFLPMDVPGKFSFPYHIFMGLFVGMTAILLDNNWDKIKNKFKKTK